MKLLSFIPNTTTMKYFNNSWEEVNTYVSSLGLDGIETMIGSYYPYGYLDKANVLGLHTMYYPIWMDFWRNDKEKLIEDFFTYENISSYYGGDTRESLINHYKLEFENAKKLGVKYMVFHVSHVRPRDIFTFSYDYSHMDVLLETVNLINEVFNGEGPMLLFENLWWQGLTLRDERLATWFLDSINYTNKGFLLDLSHLIIACGGADTIEEGASLILNTLDSIPNLIKYIKGVHVNSSTSREYLNQDHLPKLTSWLEADTYERYSIQVDHVKSIDTHSVFDSHKLRDILDIIQPEFTTLELGFSDIPDLTNKIKKQLKYM